MADFGQLPSGVTLNVKPFTAKIEEQKIQDLKQLLKLSPIAAANFENSENGRHFGINRDWLIKAKEYWLNGFDWRKAESRINSSPNFTAVVKDKSGHEVDVHFIALFSQKADAIPLAFFHGWPGSILEFLSILDILKEKYTPQDLPYHIIVPSLPGYAFSGNPPVDRDWGLEEASQAMDALLVGLGFESGYLAQGGDLGSFVSRQLAATAPSCKGMHLNFSPMGPPKNVQELSISTAEQEALGRAQWFRGVGMAYALEHGTRTATIGFALAASPLALLSWIGEKFLDWSDEDPSLDTILESVSLYWLTETFPRCIYPYRGNGGSDQKPKIANIYPPGMREATFVEKPSGYSFFPKELVPMPVSWVGTSCNLVSSNIHQSGGHFAALEKPAELLADVEEYVKKAWKPQGGKL